MHFLRSRRGFTLIEVIIVVGITAVLASLILTYTSTSRDQVALYVEEAKLAQTVSRAKALAITTASQKVNGEVVIPCGYGVHFDYDEQTYSVFSYLVKPCKSITSLDPAVAVTSVTTKLPLNVRIVGTGKEKAAEDVFFVPPDPKTWIWDLDYAATSTEGYVYLETTNQDPAKRLTLKVQITDAGQITFK